MKKCECYDLSLSNLNTRMALPVRPCLNLSDYECLDAMKRNFDVNACRQAYCPLESVRLLNTIWACQLCLIQILKEYNGFIRSKCFSNPFLKRR